jgi:hypothetical protein
MAKQKFYIIDDEKNLAEIRLMKMYKLSVRELIKLTS